MSLKSSLKEKFGNTGLWKVARRINGVRKSLLRYVYVFGAFLLGWCSWDKLKAYIREDTRTMRKGWAQYEGREFDAPTKYNGKRILTLDEANKFIGDAIEAGAPFMAGRYGNVELNATWRVRDDGKGFMAPYKAALSPMCSNAGFFPEDKDMMMKFAMLMRQSTYQANIMGVWFNPMEEWMLRTYGNNPEYCRLHSLDPYVASEPWSAKLEGKKVLVIHPFKKTIESQYARRELLFPGRNVLPKFELRVVKAVQTIAGNRDERFTDWFGALEYMYNEAMKEDFDVAIIGCGAYGFPLAAKIKEAGKIAIHLGGVTQMMFGIKGRRWETAYKGAYPELMKNPAWVRPFEEDRPKGLETIEGGCYW